MGCRPSGTTPGLDISREEQDEFAARSHQRAAPGPEERAVRRGGRPGLDPAAQGRPDRVPGRRGHPRRHHGRVAGPAQAGVRQGRHHHRRHLLADLRRRLRGRGHVPGEGRGARPPVLAEIGAHGVVAGPDNSLQSQPANAIRKALDRAGLTVDDLDLVEINEAFAAVGIQSARARRRRRQGQRQRRRHRPRPPDRDERRPDRPARRAGAAPPRRRGRPPSVCAAAAGRATPLLVRVPAGRAWAASRLNCR